MKHRLYLKKSLLVLVALSVLCLCGCGAKKEANATSADKSAVKAQSSEAIKEKSSEKLETEQIAFGTKEDAKYLLQIDINPSVIVGYAENQEVVYIASNNEDGNIFLENHDAEKILGEPIDAAIGSIMLAAHEDGYEAGHFDVEIRFVSEEKGAVEDILQITQKAVELCDFDITATVEEENEIIYNAAEKEAFEQDDNEAQLCATCNGEGVLLCDECKGAGERLVTVQREKEVRNDYVCEICGGKGWIDDGMHGGEIGNCDTCGGMEGKDSSADFKAKAYDLVMVDEEEMRFCDPCNGSGSVLCPDCNGVGTQN